MIINEIIKNKNHFSRKKKQIPIELKQSCSSCSKESEPTLAFNFQSVDLPSHGSHLPLLLSHLFFEQFSVTLLPFQANPGLLQGLSISVLITELQIHFTNQLEGGHVFGLQLQSSIVCSPKHFSFCCPLSFELQCFSFPHQCFSSPKAGAFL